MGKGKGKTIFVREVDNTFHRVVDVTVQQGAQPNLSYRILQDPTSENLISPSFPTQSL